MAKRLFIALKISKKLQKKIKEYSKFYQDYPVRWLPSDNLHITMIPPFYTDEIENIKDLLSAIEAASNREIILNFNKISIGPNIRNPRLIWLEGDTPVQIIKIKESLESILEPYLTELEKRAFKLHLTIARFKKTEYKKFPKKNIQERIDWTEKITKFYLIESRLTNSGAIHTILGEYNMGLPQI